MRVLSYNENDIPREKNSKIIPYHVYYLFLISIGGKYDLFLMTRGAIRVGGSNMFDKILEKGKTTDDAFEKHRLFSSLAHSQDKSLLTRMWNFATNDEYLVRQQLNIEEKCLWLLVLNNYNLN